MSQVSGRPSRPPVDDTDIKVRNRRMLIVGAVMVALGFVVAVGYWYTHQPGKAAPPPTALSITKVEGNLVVGSARARHHLIIKEAFDCSRCASFEQSVQAFLQADAAANLVQIQYEIPTGTNAAYDAALASNPSRALSIHDRTFTQAVAGRSGTLVVLLDGTALVESDPIDLANALESALAQ